MCVIIARTHSDFQLKFPNFFLSSILVFVVLKLIDRAIKKKPSN